MSNDVITEQSELIKGAIELLESGDSDGCDGLIVVDISAYRRLQRAVKAATGIDHGEAV